MKIFKKFLIGIGVFFTATFVFLLIYKMVNSMEVIETQVINDHALEKKLLIASQGSDYKNTLTSQVADYFKEQRIYIKILDLSKLTDVSIDNWDAVLIVCTTEGWKIPKPAVSFLEKLRSYEKIVMLQTSGDGALTSKKFPQIDTVTSASEEKDLGKKSRLLIEKIGAVLADESVKPE